MQVWNLRILSMHFIHLECLHYSGTQTYYYMMRNYVYIFLWHGLSTLFRHKDLRCLLYSFTLTVFFIMATNVCISMACVFTIPATVFLITSSGFVYVVLALGVSSLVHPLEPSLGSGAILPLLARYKTEYYSLIFCSKVKWRQAEVLVIWMEKRSPLMGWEWMAASWPKGMNNLLYTKIPSIQHVCMYVLLSI